MENLSRGFYIINIFFGIVLRAVKKATITNVARTKACNCLIGYTAIPGDTFQSLSPLEKTSFQHFHTTFPQFFSLLFVQFAQVFFSTFFDTVQCLFHPKPVENSVETVQNLANQRLFPQSFPESLWKTLSSSFSKIIFLCTFFCVFTKTINHSKIEIKILRLLPKVYETFFSSYRREKQEKQATL